MADSDMALAALNQARQWALENVDFDVSNVEVDGEYLIVDFRVTGPGGKVWFDDRNRIRKPRLWVPDGTTTPTSEYVRPNGDMVFLSSAQFQALTRTQQRALTATGRTWDRPNFQFAPRLAILRDLLHTAKLYTKDWSEPWVMRDAEGNLLGDILTVFSDFDARLTSGNSNIATARAGSSVAVVTTSPQLSGSEIVGASTQRFYMGHLAFDTSGLGPGATISGAVISLSGTGTAETDDDNATLEARFRDTAGADPTTSEWFNISTTGWTGKTLLGTLDITTWNQTSGAYNNLADAGNYGDYNLTGYTRIVIGNSLFPTGTPTGDNYVEYNASEAAGTTSDPKLVITFTPALKVPPKDHHYRQLRS